MNAEDRAILERADQLAREITDREWLEMGVSQEELDRSRLSTQQMYAALREGYSMDEVLRMFDCLPDEATSTGETPVQQFLQPGAGANRPVAEARQVRSGRIRPAQETR